MADTKTVKVTGEVVGAEDESAYRARNLAGTDAVTDPGDEGNVVPLVRVIVTRPSGEQIATDVPEHEIPILQAIHGDEAVQPDEDAGDVGEMEVPTNLTAELARLRNKYNVKAQDVVGDVTQNGARLESFGFKAKKLGERTAAPAQASIKVRKPAARSAAKKSAK
ncbi:hypothetical protein MASR1M8_15930 [Thermomonas brevis]